MTNTSLEMLYVVAGTCLLGGVVFGTLLGWPLRLTGDTATTQGQGTITSARRERTILVVFCFLYLAVFIALPLHSFAAFNMGMVDLGHMDQAIWNSLQGRILSFTYTDFGGNVSRLMVHVEPIYLLIAPLFLLWDDVRLLLILQTMLLALGAFPVYWIAQSFLKHGGLALAFAGAYLLFPSLHYANLFEFHGDPLAILPLLLCFWFLTQRRWKGFWLCAVLAMMCKEWVSLLIAMTGLFLAFRERELKVGIGAIVVGVLWFVLATQVVRGFYGGSTEALPAMFTGISGGATGIVQTALMDPGKILRKLLTPTNVGMFVLMLLPLGFLSLWRLDALAMTTPILLGLFLVGMDIRNHRNATLIPIILFAAVLGATKLKGWLQRRADEEGRWGPFRLANYERALTASLACFAVSSAVFVGPSPLSWKFWTPGEFLYWGNLHNFRITGHDRITDQFVKQIPPNVPISVSSNIAPHLTHRETCYSFPYPEDLASVDYVLVDLLENHAMPWIPRQREKEKLADVWEDSRFALTRAEDGLLLFQKEPVPQTLNQEVRLLEKAPRLQSVFGQLGNRLELLGCELLLGPLEAGKKVRLVYYWKVLPGYAEPFTSPPYCREMESLKTGYFIADVLTVGSYQWRIVHHPTYILHPPEHWQPGQILREEMEQFVPENWPAGEPTWALGLYVAYEKFPIQIDKSHRVPGTELILVKRDILPSP